MEARVRWGSRLAVLAALTIGGLSCWAPAHAAPSDEQALAERFAPVLRIVHQDVECGPGEPYRPSDVDAFLGNDTVALRGPWEQDDLVKIAPTAEDLSAGLPGYHLDFPGSPLEPGCDYEQWARTATAGTRPTMYAHVATEASRGDRLALQYWFYYPFNDYNNKHESDWEMIQLVFATSDPAKAIDQVPLEVGYSQHAGSEVAHWDDPKLDLVDGTHPVVHVASGSHANYFDSALYLGRSGEQGFGCDDTRAPTDDLHPALAVIPHDQGAARAAFPWIAYEGRWGQREAAFYNGPTGPNTKTRWTSAITYQEQESRDVSYAVPAAGLFGTTATDLFCGAVAGGSDVVRRAADNPLPVLVVLGLIGALALFLVRRTAWRPTAPLRLARRRSGGQVLAAAVRMYASRWRLFTGIGVLTIPVSLAVTALQALILGAPETAGVPPGGEGGGFRVATAALVSFLLLGAAVVLVLAATTAALGEIDADRAVGVRRAYRLALGQLRALGGAFVVSSVLVGVLGLTILLAPVAAVLVVSFALYVPVVVLEGTAAVAGLRRSAALVRQRILKVTVLLAISIALATAVGPVLGTLLILATSAPFPLVNVVSGVTFALVMPYVGLAIAYVYFDARVSAGQAAVTEATRDVLPAEAPLG